MDEYAHLEAAEEKKMDDVSLADFLSSLARELKGLRAVKDVGVLPAVELLPGQPSLSLPPLTSHWGTQPLP